VSDVPGGPGWWQASDGKWYPPQPPPVPPPPAPGQLPATSYGSFVDGSVTRRNGLAIASLVCSIVGLLIPLGGVLGIVFGFVARNQIRRSNGTLSGTGLALAGIIVGCAEILIYAIVFVDVLSSHTAT